MDGWLDAADRQLASSIFGIDDRSGVEQMILVGTAQPSPSRSAWGAAITVALADKSPIFVVAWPGTIERASLSAQLVKVGFLAKKRLPAHGSSCIVATGGRREHEG